MPATPKCGRLPLLAPQSLYFLRLSPLYPHYDGPQLHYLPSGGLQLLRLLLILIPSFLSNRQQINLLVPIGHT